MKRWLFILAWAPAGCHPSVEPAPASSPAPAPTTLGTDYADWPSVTKSPYPIAPMFIPMCAPPSPEVTRALEAERKELGPHAESAVVVRVSPRGRDQFMAGRPVPPGTVVVKEKFPKYTPGLPPTGVAVMIKQEPGYDPAHGDWEYRYEQRWPEAEKKVVWGKLESCIDCHARAGGTDYLFRPYLKPAGAR